MKIIGSQMEWFYGSVVFFHTRLLIRIKLNNYGIMILSLIHILGDLSDVLEDMDQISERLEELQIQIQELEGLEKQYNHYNKVLLYQASLELKVQNRTFNDRKKELDECRRNLDSAIDCGKMCIRDSPLTRPGWSCPSPAPNAGPNSPRAPAWTTPPCLRRAAASR